MPLKPEVSLTVGLATAAMVYGIYSNSLPSVADIRSVESMNDDIAATEKTAAWTAAAAVGAVSLISKDATVFILGGGMIVALAWWHRHANMVNPEWGMAVPRPELLAEQFDISQEDTNASYQDYTTEVY